ncbi:hypothetical protein [Ruegeria sp. YS9]|jgi:hypothetical protein|uniref:hypothetical protein n=1 Tax=Ruegeria sp. YS9 TaxID=2966453 RepID=UPI00214BC883|nr:hypothetical protein [Ruegeria sp. YS9]UUV08699.1 hypothetical protein NOR97_20980 [Ruegeria sp. YS9]
MKQYEHEVLIFDLRGNKGLAEMQAKLAEWGAAGFELVSVVPSDMHSRSVTAFLKREVSGLPIGNGEAA